MFRLSRSVLAWALACLPLVAFDPPTGVPSYSEAGVVQLASLLPGPVAPNSLMAIFGKELAWVTVARSNDDETVNTLPLLLSGTGVMVSVNGLAAPIEMVSPEQVNFLIPANLLPGKAEVRLVMNGRAGPVVELDVVEAAPAIYTLEEGIALARHEDTFEWVDRARPAQPGEWIRLYVSGLGQTVPTLGYRELPRREAEIQLRDQLSLIVGDVELTGEWIAYAGIMPGFPGLYEIRFQMPEILEGDPAVIVRILEQSSQSGVRLVTLAEPPPVVEPVEPEPEDPESPEDPENPEAPEDPEPPEGPDEP
ncbi:MAG: hypothetical protein IH602_06585 [Bryobacteraceae bacterium]|nr:hypothetical protein [Bryobacteraceae bacterium]